MRASGWLELLFEMHTIPEPRGSGLGVDKMGLPVSVPTSNLTMIRIPPR